MPDPEYVTLKAQTASSIARDAMKLVAAERISQEIWASFPDERRAGILVLVEETMLRLLENPQWVPGSLVHVVGSANRLDVTFTVDLGELDRAIGEARDREAQIGGDPAVTLLDLHRHLTEG